MINAERIVCTLDSILDHEVSLVIYGRAAIALGFTNPPSAVANSLDVDVILRDSQTQSLDADDQFWDSQAAVNVQLDRDGLYMTHIFGERQVFLRRRWESEILPVLRPPLKHLRLFRPATIDLILTKMMRGNDEQDMQDVDFMIRHDRVAILQIEDAFRDAVIPDCIELRDAYERAKPTVLAIARAAADDGFTLPKT
ncbi:MAG: hypothetical protein ABMA01_23250 [Chthoniobacteraceae bacterium]